MFLLAGAKKKVVWAGSQNRLLEFYRTSGKSIISRIQRGKSKFNMGQFLHIFCFCDIDLRLFSAKANILGVWGAKVIFQRNSAHLVLKFFFII